jgi:TRAP-type C4-dicarboxylate transport system permease small subunit
MSSPRSRTQQRGLAAYWTLRVLETVLLLSSLAAMALFAWSIVDIVHITLQGTATDAILAAPLLVPSVFLFLGSMVLLQVVRVVLGGSRRADGSPKADARGAAAETTAAALASLEDDPETVPTAADTMREG